MLNQQSTSKVYPAIKEKLRPVHLPPPEITKALAGLSADTAATYLCRCAVDEDFTRRGREKATLIWLAMGLLVWTALNVSWGSVSTMGWPLFLVGPLLISLAVWLTQRRFGPLRDNALTGLTQVILEVHERETLEPLCETTALLNGGKRRWEMEIETALRTTIARLLTRLSADEAALLANPVREFLLTAITDNRHTELTVAALLTLGSARDEIALPYAETLRASLVENVREAALEYIQELRGRA
ncbi:hypothetical protein [Armatimonas sp.]|uniref:hypothetical protein n=1 Tax=Armatimonas sp. TaxID=1872638 RepID=UPI00375206D2